MRKHLAWFLAIWAFAISALAGGTRQSRGKRIDDRKDEADDCRGRRARIENAFSNFTCRGVERIDGRLYGQVFPLLLLRKSLAIGAIN